jgi:galactose mutarotase-like enzyme
VGLIPTGKFLPVAVSCFLGRLMDRHCRIPDPPNSHLLPKDTPLDFRTPKPIGRDIAKLFPDGYDNCFVVDRSSSGAGLALAARLTDPTSKRTMEVYTTGGEVGGFSPAL